MLTTIEFMQNIASIVTCSTVCYNLAFYYAYLDKIYLEQSAAVICVHLVSDLLIETKRDVIIHHWIGLYITFAGYVYGIDYGDGAIVLTAIYKTEISTIFLAIKMLKSHIQRVFQPEWRVRLNPVFYVNDAVFVILFLKYRIYDYSTKMLFHPSTYQQLAKYTHKPIDYLAVYGGLYAMFILNLYWLSLMIKVAWRKCVVGAPADDTKDGYRLRSI